MLKVKKEVFLGCCHRNLTEQVSLKRIPFYGELKGTVDEGREVANPLRKSFTVHLKWGNKTDILFAFDPEPSVVQNV